MSRIRIRSWIRNSVVRILGSGSVPKCHWSTFHNTISWRKVSRALLNTSKPFQMCVASIFYYTLAYMLWRKTIRVRIILIEFVSFWASWVNQRTCSKLHRPNSIPGLCIVFAINKTRAASVCFRVIVNYFASLFLWPKATFLMRALLHAVTS
jgi:hypothetical protein